MIQSNRAAVAVGWMSVVVMGAIGGSQAARAESAVDTPSEGAVWAPLAPGDAVELRFWREPDLEGRYLVDETNAIVLPILGTRSVAGRSLPELKRELLDAYEQELRNQEIQITLLRRVRILGAVNSPGLYHVDPTMTLADAIAIAGGRTREGTLKGVRLMRGQEVIRSNIDDDTFVIEGIHSGDQIVVSERSWFKRNSVALVGGLFSAAAILASAAFF